MARAKRGGEVLETNVSRGNLRKLDQTTRTAWGKNLARLMRAAKLTQAELAKLTFEDEISDGGIDHFGRDRISKYLNGKSFPENETISKLCNALKCTVAELIPPPIMSVIEKLDDPKTVIELDGSDYVTVRISGRFHKSFVPELTKFIERNKKSFP